MAGVRAPALTIDIGDLGCNTIKRWVPKSSDKVARRHARKIFEGHFAKTHDYRAAASAAGVSARTGRRWLAHRVAHESGAAPPQSLPNQLTSFIGRERELGELDELYDEASRLVTLVGPPGIGKTRLAARAARGFSGRVYFADLREASAAQDVFASVAQVLGVRLDASLDPAEQLGQSLAARQQLLLVLDNFEQLVEVGPRTIGSWLVRAPLARFLVTSRRALRLRGERLYELGALSLPASPTDQTSEAMALFFARARAVQPSFVLTDRLAAEVIPLLECLEGLPLAIELAAAQMRRLGPRELLSQRASLAGLRNDARDADPRHASLWSAIDSSWQSLSSSERSTLAQLTVFRGGFDVPAADGVVDVDPAAPPVTEILSLLREKSLISVYGGDELAAGLRYRFYDAIRQYAEDKLDARSKTEVRARHASYFLALGESGRTPESAWPRELDNLRAALAYFAAEKTPGAASSALRLALVIHATLRRWQPALGVELMTLALEAAGWHDGSGLPVARVLAARAESSRNIGQLADAEADVERSLEIASRCSDEPLLAKLAYEEGVALFWRGSLAEAEPRLRDALERAQACAEPRLEGKVRNVLAGLLGEALHDAAAASEQLERACELFRECGDAHAEANARRHLCHHQMRFEGGHPSLVPVLEECAAMGRRHDDGGLEAGALVSLAVVHQEHGRLEAAQDCYRRAQEAAAGSGLKRPLGIASMMRGTCFDEADDLVSAQRTYEQARDLAVAVGEQRIHGLCLALLSGVHAELGALDRAEALLRKGLGLMEKNSERGFLEAAALEAGHLDLARFRRALAAGDREQAERHRERVTERIRRAHAVDANSAGGLSLARRSEDARIVLRLLERRLQRDEEAAGPALRVAEGGCAFQLTGQPLVTLPNGPVIRAAFWALVEQRLDAPGRPLTRAELIERCWGAERMQADSASGRLRNLIARLRKMGLKDVLVTISGGYLLDADVALWLRPQVGHLGQAHLRETAESASAR